MDWDSLVLREGDRVEAWGRLVRAEAGEFLEPPVPVPAIATPMVRAPTGFGVRVVGADFDGVERRKEYGGRVEGTATLSGRWLHGEFHVESQTPRRIGSPPRGRAWVKPPCPPPPEGWPNGKRDANLRFDLKDLEASGAAVAVTVFRPSPTQTVLVVAAANPPAVEAVLRPQLGARLCIVPSRCSRAQVDAARDTLDRRMDQSRIWAVGAGPDDQGQPVITVELTLVEPDLAVWLAEQPEGLVRADAWLVPSSALPTAP